jgi:diacylglycerol kinase family enzyme
MSERGVALILVLLVMMTLSALSMSLAVMVSTESRVAANYRDGIEVLYGANAAALGLSPLIADTVPHNLKRYLGMVGYMLWAIRVALKFRPFKLRVTLDDGTVVKSWATEARIANGTHHGGVELVEDQELDSGEIVIQAVTGKSLWGLAWSWFATLFKLRSRKQTVTEWWGRKLYLEARPAQKISIDGEIAARTPVTVEVADACIEVAAPVSPTG